MMPRCGSALRRSAGAFISARMLRRALWELLLGPAAGG
jgi:hypothetical protein